MPGDQVAGDRAAQAASGAGDEDGAIRVDQAGACLADAGGGYASELGDAGCPVADGDLGFGGGQGGGDRVAGGVVVVEVEEGEAAGVLGLGGPDQAPDGSVCQVSDVFSGDCGDGAASDHGQACVGELAGGEPVLRQSEHLAGGGMGAGS